MAVSLIQSPLPVLSAEQAWSAKWGHDLSDQPQAFPGLPREAYDELPGWNASLLKKVWNYTEAHAWAEFINPSREESEEQERFLIGNLLHCRLLEPELWNDRYVVIPDDAPPRPTEKQLLKEEPRTKTTKAYEEWSEIQMRKAWWASFDLQHNQKQIITPRQQLAGDALAQAVLKHPVLGPRFLPTEQNRAGNELTLTWIDFKTGSRCKCRIDALRVLPDCLWIGDLKSAQDARPGPDGFGRAAANFNYLLSAAFYLDATFFCRPAIEQCLGLPDGSLITLPYKFELIAIEKTHPMPQFVSRHELTEDQLELGRRQARWCLDRVVQAEASGWWPGYSTAAQPLELPGYFYQKVHQRLESSNDD